MSYEAIQRLGRRKHLFEHQETTHETHITQEHIKRMIPHRDPFLLLDGIDRVDLVQPAMRGFRHIDPNDPVFAGHFPNHPVYPGTLQMEMIGQLSLCLDFMIKHNLTTDMTQLPAEVEPPNLRLLRVHHGIFLAEVSPGDRVWVTCGLIERTAYTFVCKGQVLKNDTICCMGIMEVYLMDEDG